MKLFDNSKPDKHRKTKVALIPLLVLAFGYVLLTPEASSVPPRSVSKTTPALSQVSLPAPNRAAVPAASHAIEEEWQEMLITEIIQHDPFRLLPRLKEEQKRRQDEILSQSDNPTQTATGPVEHHQTRNALNTQQEAEKKLNRIKDSLKQNVISGILYSPENKAAIINSQIYQEGDLLEEGIRVGKISPTGVLFQIEDAKESTLE